MKSFTREEDRKEFTCVERGHWSKIQSQDGEVDYVKYIGSSFREREEWYISMHQGFRYTSRI